ncbi:hypothetical protein V9T40_011597 [Parthenolecanium corni]|uniref:Uncharacterized protein n=1 Tax=Parthenolecanium corni TaxID=536013 RepID=A0AAN9XYB1_9HEMI
MWVGNENSCINTEQGSLYPKSETESMFQGYNKTKIKERKELKILTPSSTCSRMATDPSSFTPKRTSTKLHTCHYKKNVVITIPPSNYHIYPLSSSSLGARVLNFHSPFTDLEDISITN